MPDSETTITPGGIASSRRSVRLTSTREVAQVAVVDADDLRPVRERALELVLVVHLDEHVEAELARLRRAGAASSASASAATISSTASAPAARASSSW